MSAHEEERIKQLLKQAMPRVGADEEPGCDLWPEMLKRLDRNAAPAVDRKSLWVWFDLVLLAGLAVLGVAAPATIPLLLYYL